MWATHSPSIVKVLIKCNVGNTSSHSITEVMKQWSLLILGWATFKYWLRLWMYRSVGSRAAILGLCGRRSRDKHRRLRSTQNRVHTTVSPAVGTWSRPRRTASWSSGTATAPTRSTPSPCGPRGSWPVPTRPRAASWRAEDWTTFAPSTGTSGRKK